MRIVENINNSYIKENPLVVALGNFDGVHLGHRILLDLLKAKASESKALPTLLTFSPHPLKVIDPRKIPPLLLTEEQKVQKFTQAGVELVIKLPFTRETAAMTPDTFVRDILVEGLGAKGIVVGYNFNFGCGGKGTARLLKSYQKKYGFFLEVVPPVRLGGSIISSTAIRRFLQEGRVEKAAELLGYTPFLEGLVVKGRQIGQTLGYPTANLKVPEEIIIPARGVYAVRVICRGQSYCGIANIGIRPTFAGTEQQESIEINIFDFSANLYGKSITVEFARRIRPEKKFSSPEDLVEQIAVDVKLTRQYFGLAVKNNRIK